MATQLANIPANCSNQASQHSPGAAPPALCHESEDQIDLGALKSASYLLAFLPCRLFNRVRTRYIGHDKYENILIGVKNRDPYEDHDCIYALYGDFSLIGVEDFDPRVT